jgi:hypothetical protein
VAAVPSGLSITRSGHARHRAQRSPALLPVAVLLALIALAVGWRLVGTPSNSDPADQGALTTGTPSSRTTVSIGLEGDVHVVMNLVFEAPRREITLWVSPPTEAGFEFQPRVEVLGLDANARRRTLDETLDVGETVSVPLDPAVDQVRLEYSATGTFLASRLSAPGRGLVLLTPLTVLDSDIPSHTVVTDARVLNLGCADSAQTRACGNRSGDRWTVDRFASDEMVVAQVDLVRADS